jgi:hypothetical protein
MLGASVTSGPTGISDCAYPQRQVQQFRISRRQHPVIRPRLIGGRGGFRALALRLRAARRAVRALRRGLRIVRRSLRVLRSRVRGALSRLRVSRRGVRVPRRSLRVVRSLVRRARSRFRALRKSLRVDRSCAEPLWRRQNRVGAWSRGAGAVAAIPAPRGGAIGTGYHTTHRTHKYVSRRTRQEMRCERRLQKLL